MVKLVNRAKMSTATTGTGTITLGSAESGYQSFADAGVADGETVRYVIEDGSNWEIGTGTYTASGTTLTRSVSESSNADAAINLSGSAVVFVSATAADLFAAGASTFTDTEFTATGGQTSFSATYTVGAVEVFVNGVLLGSADYTATSGTAVVLASGATAGDLVTVRAYAFTSEDTLFTNVAFTGSIEEEVFTLSGTTPALDPANGTIQTWTLAGNSTPTDSLAAGEYITLMIDDGSAHTITWPTMQWAGGSAPALATTGYSVVELWKVGSTLYGASVGDMS